MSKSKKTTGATALKIIVILAAVILTVILALILSFVISSKGKVKPVTDNDGNQIAGSISEKCFVEINGFEMGMFIRSADAENPVLLFLHGGPGMPEYFLEEKYPTGLEKYFTVVYADQRGAGLSYSDDISAEAMNIEQLADDTAVLTEYLKERFGKEKIYLMGHSWGSAVGIMTAHKYPELYYAYIGMGQIANDELNSQMNYEYLVNYFTEKGDNAMVRKINKYKTDDGWNAPGNVVEQILCKAGAATTRECRSDALDIFLPIMWNSEYTFGEKCNIWLGKMSSAKTQLMQDRYIDFINVYTEFELPIYFFSGAYDYTVNHELSAMYLDKITAPDKGFYLFEDSAHSPLFEEPEKAVKILLDICK